MRRSTKIKPADNMDDDQTDCFYERAAPPCTRLGSRSEDSLTIVNISGFSDSFTGCSSIRVFR